MTCRKCLHAPVCFDSEGCTKYYGPEIAANNVEELCIHFVDRSRYVVREKGEWLLDGRCSICLKNPLTTHVSFCPACGSDMRKMQLVGGLASWYADKLANDIQVETGVFKK